MKRNILTLTILTVFVCQALSQTMTYDITDDESKTQNLMVGISLLDFTMGSAALSFSGGADADFYINRLSAEAGFRFSWYDLKRNIIKGTNESNNKLKGYKDFRVGGRFHFVDKVGKKKMKATLSTEYKGTSTVTTFLPVQVPTRRIVALHFGIQYYNSPIKARRDSSVTATDGTKLSEWQSGTNLNATMLYGGFSFIDIMKARVNSGGDHWNFKWYRNMYFDVLFAPLINIQDIEVGGKSYKMQGSGTKGFETNPWGGRFGYSNMASKVFIKYEIGWYPGLARKGLFTQATFGLSLIKAVKTRKA
jgi:hypothetical protein